MFLEKTQLPIAKLGKILEALFLDGNVNNRTFPRRTAPSLMKTLSMGRDASSLHTASWKVVYIYVIVHTVLVTRNLTKSDEFRRNSARISCRFCKASVQLTAELQYYFCGRVSPISTE